MSWIKDRIKERDGREQKIKQTTSPTAASPKTTTQNDQRPQPAQSGQAGASSPSWIHQRIQERQENQQRAAQRESGRALKLMAQDAANATRDRIQDTVYGWNSMFKSAADREGERAAREAERFERDRKLYQNMAESAGKTGYAALLERAQEGIADRAARWQDAADSYQTAAAKEREDYLNGLKQSNKSAWYGETLSREQIEGQLRQLEMRKAETVRQAELATEAARNDADRARVYSSQAGDGPWYMKALWNANEQKEEIDAEIARYQAALRYRNSLDKDAEMVKMAQSISALPDFQRLAEAGKAMVEGRNKKARETMISPNYTPDDPDDGRQFAIAERKEREALLAAGYVSDLDSSYIPEEIKPIYYALFTKSPAKAQEFAAYWAEKGEQAYWNAIYQQSGEDAGERLKAFIEGTFANAVAGLDPFGEGGQYAAKLGKTMIGGGAAGLTEKGLFNTGFGAGTYHSELFGDINLGSAYQLGSSMLQSAANATLAKMTGGLAGITGGAGTILLGSSAAASDYQEKIEQGWDESSAKLHALAAGAAESVFEYVSMDKLIKEPMKLGVGAKWRDIFKQGVRNFFVQGGVEASEEVSTTLANRVTDALISELSGYENRIDSRKRELIEQGYESGTAEKKAEKEWLTEVMSDALGGFASGGLMSAGQYAMYPMYKAAGAIESRRQNALPEETEARSPEELDAYEEGRQSAERELAELDDQALEERFLDADDALYNAEQDGDLVEIQRARGAYEAVRDETNRRTGERETGKRILRSAQNDGTEDADYSPAAQNDGTENDASEVYQQTLRETAEQIREMDDGELRVVAASVEQNLTEVRDSADPVELARMEGQLDAMRREISRREAVDRNGERLARATEPAALTGKVDEFAADWNGSRETEDADPSTPLRHEASPLGRSAQNDRRADVGIGPYGNQTEGGLNDGEYQQGGRQGAVLAGNGGQIAERAEQGPADGGQRDAGLGADRQTGGLGGRAEGSVAGGQGKTRLRDLKNYVQALGAERQSPQSIGVKDGTQNASVILLDVEALTGPTHDSLARVQEKAERDGVRISFTLGAIETWQNGKTVKAGGVMQIDPDGTPHVFLQADSMKWTAEQLYEHEMFHVLVARNKGLWRDIVDYLRQTHTPEEIRNMVDAYVQAYDGCYGYDEADTELYLEEIFADVYADMQRGGIQAGKARELARGTAQRFAGDIENARQNRAGIERRNGPGTRLAFEDGPKITVDSTDEERYEILSRKRIAPAIIDAKKLAGIDLEKYVTKKVDAVESGLREIANKLGLIGIDFRNSQLEFPFQLSGRSFHKSLVHQLEYGGSYQDYAKMMSCFNDLVANAQLIETHNEKKTGTSKENRDLKQSYVLLSAYQDGAQIVPVELLVKEFWLNKPGLYMVVTMTKIDSEVFATPAAGETGGTAKLFSESKYSLRDILANVNTRDDRFLKYVPDGFLSEDQIAAKRNALARQKKDYESFGETPKREHHQQNLLENRVSGDTLLDAKDLIETVRDVGGQVDERGYITVYHRTTAEKAEQIRSSGKMIAKEDGLFFSVNQNAQDNQGYGDTVLVLRIPAEKLVLDDIFADDASVRIPLGNKRRMDISRFLVEDESGGVDWAGNRGTMLSPADEDDENDWAVKDAEDETPLIRQPDGLTPSPEEEGSGRETRRADVGIGPYEDEGRQGAGAAEGNGRRSMSAPTEERGRQSAVPTEQSYEVQAREKKVEIAARTSVEGLKSKLEGAEKRLSAWKMLEKSGMVTDAAKRQELQRRIADTQETIDVMKAELDRKKAARSAQKADQAKKAETRNQRKAEKMEAQKAAELRDNKPRQARKEFRQDALNLFSVPAAKRQTLGDLLNRFADKVIHQGSVTEQDRRELFTSLYEAGVETIQADEYYKQIRDFARGGRIYVPQELRSEFGDNWEAFRKRAWGNGIYLTNDQNDRGANAWNVELAELFPGSFDAGETDGRNILEGIVELAEEGKAEHVSIEEMMLRNQQETGVSVDEQMDELERKVDALIDTFAQKAELEVKLRKAGTMQLVKERQKNREIAARQAQRKKENDTRSQVMKQLQALNKMRKKSDPEIQRQIDEIIGNLDVMARSISPEGLENLQELARKYAEAAEDPNFLGNPYVEQRLARLEKVQLDTKDISEVIELGRTVSALVKSVTEDKRLLTDAREREISDAAEAVNKEILSSEGSKGGKLREFLGNEHLSPTRMIQRLGGWVRGGMMEQLSRALEDGGSRRMDYQRQATRIFDRFVADKANQAWLRKAQGKDAEWIKVKVPTSYVVGEDGRTGMGWTEMEITPMMRVGLLMHSRNADNLRHIQTGGIVIPNKAQYIKGNLSEADARGTRVKLQPETVRAIVKDCTAQERAFAALLEQYYDGFSKDRINEVSMQIDGFERAGGDHYYGIKVSRKFLAAQPEQIQKNMSLESIGSIVNERVHAGNPIILEDASTALTGHIDLISKYYGYTAAIRDFNAVMNYTFHQKATTENGQEYTANAFAGSVKETLGEKWGSGAQKYLDDLLADLQQKSSINETAAQVMAKLRGNLAAASLTLNPAVALSQTASLPGAAQVLGLDGVIAALKPEKVDMGLVEKYSPVLWYRNQGNSTQELGDYMATKGMGDSLPWWANWIQKMDSWTIRRLWAGAEYRVSKDTDLSPGSKAQVDAGEDAYYQEVARVFQRAVYDTQPNYSEMQRPAILRSKSDLTKALTMYKTVPLQYYNMMYEAFGRLRADAARVKADPNSKQAQAELQKSKALLAKTFGGILGANVTYVVMKALVKGLLGGKKDKYLDEEGDLDWGKIFGNLGKDLLDTYAGSVIFGSDLLTFGEKLADAITTGKYSRYGGTEISFLSAIEDVLGGVYDLATEIHKQDFRGGVGAVKDLAKQLAMVCGIPAQNVETYLLGATKLFAPEWADRFENLFDEIERGDLKGQTGRDLRAAFRVLMDNRTDGLKDETVEELLRLWGNGQTVQVPSAVPASISIDGESRNLSADERSRFREIWGKTVSDSLEQLIESDSYEQADDAGKAKLIKKLYDYARQQAVEAAVGKEPDAWVLFGKACVDAGVRLEDYLAVAAVGKDKLKDMDGTELDAAISGRMQFRIGELGGDSLDELGRMFATGASDVIPSDVPTSITVGGQEIKFSPEERVAWMQAWQRTAGESLEAVMGSKAYQAADDAGKAKLISAVYDYARAAACSSVTDSYAPDKWITIGREAESRGIDADEYIIFRQKTKDLKSAEKLDLLKKQSWNESQKEYIWMASMASEAQLTKYKPLKESGVKWAAALDLMGVGEASASGMSPEETAKYQAAWDRISGPATKKLMNNAVYKKADKATQSAYIDRLNAYVTQMAKTETVKGYTTEKWVECGNKLNRAGVALDEFIVYYTGTSDANSRAKYTALNATEWTESQKLIVMEYISDSTHRVASVGISYQVGLSYYLDALANADADQSGNINQGEAEDYIDRLKLGWEDKAYLWQMVCASSKWKNNPYSATLGEEIWHSLHPNE